MTKALVNGRVFDGQGLHTGLAVILEGGKISALLPETDLPASITAHHDLDGHMLAPGLIDLQVNGGGGLMFNDAPTLETLGTIGAAHRRFGTTGFLPTLISTDFATMTKAIAAVGQAISAAVPGVLGIHLEGPFLNPDKSGIHRSEKFCPLDEAAFELLTSRPGAVTLVTLAPECTSPAMIKRLTAQGVHVFGGHSAATYAQTREALAAGLRGFTHLFNAMGPMQSREPGMVGAALEDRHSWCGMIADGQHIHPATFAVAVAAKRKGYSVLVTDAMATVGSGSRHFRFDGQEIAVSDGSCRLESGALAGSDLNMISAVRNAARFTGLSPTEALRMGSTYPAHALGMEGELGYIRAGYRANLIEVDDELNLFRTWIDGVEGG
ncbi:MAG: N-acetylglucosamine-6-phosphate deacetylase [Lysobacterales bacterium]